MFQNFLLKQMLKAKLKDVPAADQERILALLDKNPDFFDKIGKEVERRVKNGEKETSATMAVMREHQAELQNLLR